MSNLNVTGRVACACVLVWITGGHVQASELPVNTALQRTLTQSPQLQLYPYQKRVAEARELQAGLRPNPELGIAAENILGTGSVSGVKSAELTLTLSQQIELGDKREYRQQAARAEGQLAELQYQLDKTDVLATVLQQYLDVLRLQTLQQWTTERLQQEEQAAAVARKRATAGLVTAADEARLQNRVLRSRMDLDILHAELQLARRQLAANWGQEPDFEQVSGDLALLPALPAISEVTEAFKQSAHLQYWLSRERFATLQQQLAIANGRSDLTLSAGVKRDQQLNEQSLLFAVSIPLALHNPNAGVIAASQAEAEQSALQLNLTQQQTSLMLLRLYQQLQLLSAQIHNQRQALLPSAEQVLNTTLEGYQKGLYGISELLSAQQEVLDARRELIETQTRFHSQLIELERLTGIPLAVNGPQRLQSVSRSMP